MNIITRQDWGAKNPKSRFSKLKEVKGLVVHWSAYPVALDVEEEKAQVLADRETNANLKASAKAKLIAGEPLTEAEADTIVL